MSACWNHEAAVRPARSTRAPIAVAPCARILLTASALILTAIAAPGALATGAGSRGALPGCPEIPNRIAHHPWVLSAIAEIVPATGTLPAYCEVVITQRPAINIRIGLPLSIIDGGAGGVQGDWNGRVQNLGGGGFGGSLGPVGDPTAAGYVASVTDTGHSAAWCNAINPRTGLPNSQPNCGLAGGGFVLDPNNRLLRWQVRDFITDSIHAQTMWALGLARLYYGIPARRNYWNGCSTGGRQGLEMAQRFGHLFDGILAGAPAINWNRFQIGEFWAAIVAKEVVGPAGLAPPKYEAAGAAAIAACDADDGVVDGVINEPRRCEFDASALICSGGADDPPDCLTEAEARAINMIWDGPRTWHGDRLWGGVPKGTTFFLLLNPDPTSPVADLIGLLTAWVVNWMHEDPDYDWRQINLGNYSAEFTLSERKFSGIAATDSTRLNAIRNRGGKIIHYHGIADPLILPFGSYNYVSRLFDRYGVAGAQDFMRSFFYPGNGHCGGGAPSTPLINQANLFDMLVDWVENDNPPDFVVATNLAGSRSAKICKYPDEAVYDGLGDPLDHNSYHCATNESEPADLAADSELDGASKRLHHRFP